MRRDALFLASLVLLSFACFWPAGSLGFIGYDDIDYVYQNPMVQSGLNGDSLAWAFGGAHAGNWHPLTWMSHMVDCELFGLDPHEQHWMNLVLHTANAGLLFLWLRGLTGARWRSFFVAALFAVHPLHVQSVAWISERKDVLSGLFFMGILLAYTRYCRQKSRGNYALVLGLFALGLMAKPMLVTVPLVLLLVDFWPLGRMRSMAGNGPGTEAAGESWVALVKEKIPFFLLGLVSCGVTLWAQNSARALEVTWTSSLGGRCLHALVSYGWYLEKTLWPADLAIFYPMPAVGPALPVILGVGLLLAILLLAGFRRRGPEPYLLMGWVWFLIMLLPVIGVVQVGLQAAADRYAYLPSIGLFIALVWGLAELVAKTAARRVAMGVLGGVAVLVCGLDSRHQLGFWRDNVTLFQHVVAVTPQNNFMGHFYLGISLAEAGDLDAAARSLRIALEILPRFDTARSRLGNVLLLQKKYAEAEPYLAELARAHPENVTARVTLGLALAGERKYAAAQPEFNAAQQLNPNDAGLNQMLAANAPKAEAEQVLSDLAGQLTNRPAPETCVRGALADSVLGRYAEAAKYYRQALAQRPDAAEWLNNLAWLLAACPDAAVRDGAEAVRLAQRACDLTESKKTVFLGTLAAACAEAGQFDAAVRNAQKACDNARGLGETDLLEVNSRLLNLYQNGQAYHEEDNSGQP